MALDTDARATCEQDGGQYRWDVLAHNWECGDNWVVWGFQGV